MIANLNLEWKAQHVLQIMAKYMWNETRILDKTCRNIGCFKCVIILLIHPPAGTFHIFFNILLIH